MSSQQRRVVVVGAGAAGLFAALFAARAGAHVDLLETRPTPGAKIRVSGGGRCNVLPSVFTLENYATSGSSKLLRNILYSWPRDDVEAFFRDDLGLEMYEEPDTGKLFPRSDQAREVVERILTAVSDAGVRLHGACRVSTVESGHAHGAPFTVEADDGRSFRGDRLILATGGKSLPKTGSDGHGFELAQRFGHSLVATRPALVPLRTDDAAWTSLAGIAIPTRLTAIAGAKELEARSGALLFTHRGFSGPVALDISRHVSAERGTPSELGAASESATATKIIAAWGDEPPEHWERTLSAGGSSRIARVLSEALPRRLVTLLLDRARVPEDRPLAQLRRDERTAVLEQLTRCPLPVTGDEGYAKAEVTAGGVPLAEIQPRTLESRCCAGLYFCGEILDVVGHIGGYNFLWAWVTGRKAGMAAAG